jgi:hypothetical protein
MAGTLKTGLWRCQDLASATPSRSMLPQSGSTDSWPSSTPTGVSPGQTSRAHSLCRDQYQTRLSCAPGAHRSRRAACNRGLLDPFSRSRCPKPACRAAVQLVQVPPRTQSNGQSAILGFAPGDRPSGVLTSGYAALRAAVATASVPGRSIRATGSTSVVPATARPASAPSCETHHGRLNPAG